MSKSSTASAPKISTQLSSSSAWSRGPPQSTASAPSPRSQSPAPKQIPSQPTHSRRPSTLGQGVSFKDGVAGARTPASATKSASSMSFGSIDDAAAPISSSPASVPTIKSADAVKSFGTVPATPTSTTNGKPSAAASSSSSQSPAPVSATPSKRGFDVKTLFRGNGSAPSVSPSTSQTSADVASPSTRPVSLPQTAPQPSQSQSQPSQLGTQPYTPFVPSNNFRPPPQPNGAQSNPGGPPRSPVFPRQLSNGQVNGVGARPNGAPPAAPGAPPMQPGLSSPRMGPPHGQPATMLPQQVPMAGWPAAPYYYPSPYAGMPPESYMNPYSTAGWHMPPQVAPSPHPQPPGPQGMAMSPRTVPSQLHTPGTPTLSPAIPASAHPPHPSHSPHTHTASLSNVSSPPPTPSTSTPGGTNRLSSDARAFIPRRTGAPVKITTGDGAEVSLDNLRNHSAVLTSSPARKSTPVPVKIETPEAREKRLQKEKEEERRKKEAEERVKREAEEKERRQREEEERKKAEEEERVRKEKEKEKEERLKKEEEERKRKEEEEKERLRREEEEKEKARLQQEEEERARKQKEEEERAAAEAAASKPLEIEPIPEEPSTTEPEEGEVQEPEEAKPAAETPVTPVKEEAKALLRIDTTLPPPPEPRRRPGPLDLTSAKSQLIAQPLPSALATARIIEDLGSVSYPDGIKSPKVELNVNAKQGKFRYDRDFLLQFMAICKEKPDSLPPLDAIGLEPSDQSFSMSRGGSGRRSSSAAMPPPSSTSSRPGVGLGISGFNKPGQPPFAMGQFATPTQKMTSEDRFAAASRSTSMSGGPPGMVFGRTAPMVRSSSQGGPGSMNSKRIRSKRGVDRSEANRVSLGPGPSDAQAAAAFELVAPLEVSANRWQPASITKKPQQADPDSPEIVDRKVRGLLNKLTMERFDSISDQIIEWANKSEKEKDGRTLIQVIRLVFEKATDEATWSEMYARLCRKMMEQISANVRDDGIRSTDGKPIAGGHLFRKYLLNRCQEDFERGWVAKEATAAAAATKATEDQAAKAAAEKNEGGEGGESVLYSEEYYAAQKAKRQGLGLIKFIGELFKLQMLTERIMHECVKKLLGNVENPEEEEIESLCKLLTTVGKILDNPKARAHMDVYFSRMKELCKNPNVNSRMQFMLQDVIELRERVWVPRNQVAAPTTIAAVHEQAAKEKAVHEKESYNRTLSMSRGGSRRGGERGDHSQVGQDGWNVAGGGSQPRAPPKVGDLSKFGQISKTSSMTFGPTSVFTSKEKSKNRESASLRGGNMFSKLMENPELVAEAATTRSSRPPSRKPSVDLGSGGIPEALPQRRKLNLLPRTLPKSEETKTDSTPAASEAGNSDDEGAGSIDVPSMSESEAKARIEEDSKEFFSIRDLGEAELYFTKLPTEYRSRLVDKLVSSAIESKDADAKLVADLFARAASQNLCSPQTFEDGFTPVAEILDDIAIDAPKAFNHMATMMKGAGLDQDEERRTRLASKSMDNDKLIGLLS